MDMDKLVSLCKRRGFIFPSSEIYGGLNGFWDYGPLGVELKRNIKDAWWRDNVTSRDDMVGLDCSIIMNPKVWEASGHVGGFSDPMVDCRETKERYRADQLHVFSYETGTVIQGKAEFLRVALTGATVEDARAALDERLSKLARKGALPIKLKDLPEPIAADYLALTKEDQAKVTGPSAEKPGTLTEPRNFNLMFESHAGAIADEANKVYLRPETAQGIFANFKNVVDTGRVKLPFGIAQIGKSFRNEINPRNFTFRSREFEQMEIEFFCHPDQATEWYAYWRKTRFQWYIDHGLQSDRLRLRDHDPDELAFYSTATADIEYSFPFGVSELEGIAHRGAYDLGQHQKFSGKDLTYFDEEKKERYLPHVVEPSAGADRATLAFLCEAYHEDEGSRRNPDRAVVAPSLRADQGGRLPPGQARRDARDGRKDLPRVEASFQRVHRREGGDWPPLSSPGRGRDTAGDHGRWHHDRRRDRDLPRPRHLPPVASAVGRDRRGGPRLARRCPGARQDLR